MSNDLGTISVGVELKNGVADGASLLKNQINDLASAIETGSGKMNEKLASIGAALTQLAAGSGTGFNAISGNARAATDAITKQALAAKGAAETASASIRQSAADTLDANDKILGSAKKLNDDLAELAEKRAEKDKESLADGLKEFKENLEKRGEKAKESYDESVEAYSESVEKQGEKDKDALKEYQEILEKRNKALEASLKEAGKITEENGEKRKAADGQEMNSGLAAAKANVAQRKAIETGGFGEILNAFKTNLSERAHAESATLSEGLKAFKANLSQRLDEFRKFAQEKEKIAATSSGGEADEKPIGGTVGGTVGQTAGARRFGGFHFREIAGRFKRKETPEPEGEEEESPEGASDEGEKPRTRKLGGFHFPLKFPKFKRKAASAASEGEAGEAAEEPTGEAAGEAKGAGGGAGGALMQEAAGKVFEKGSDIAKESVKIAADFEQMTQRIQASTHMTDGELASMRKGLLDMGAQSGLSLESLAGGFKAITSAGVPAKDAMTVLNAAMQGAVGSGGDVEKISEELGKTMRAFAMPASQAGQAMNALQAAANTSGMSLQEFQESSGEALEGASKMGIGFNDATASISTLTQNGASANDVVEQMRDKMEEMKDPTSEAHEEIVKLSEATGINLAKDFTEAGMKSRGLYGVINDLAQATKGHASEVYKLIPALNGGEGATKLAKEGSEKYKDALAQVGDAMTGKASPATDNYKKSLGNLNQKMSELKGEANKAEEELGEALLPVISKGVDFVLNLAHSFNNLSPKAKDAWYVLAGGFTVISGLVSHAAILKNGFDLIKSGMAAAQLGAEGFATEVAAVLAPAAPAIIAVVAATGFVIKLAEAWQGLKDDQDAAAQSAQHMNQMLTDLDKQGKLGADKKMYFSYDLRINARESLTALFGNKREPLNSTDMENFNEANPNYKMHSVGELNKFRDDKAGAASDVKQKAVAESAIKTDEANLTRQARPTPPPTKPHSGHAGSGSLTNHNQGGGNAGGTESGEGWGGSARGVESGEGSGRRGRRGREGGHSGRSKPAPKPKQLTPAALAKAEKDRTAAAQKNLDAIDANLTEAAKGLDFSEIDATLKDDTDKANKEYNETMAAIAANATAMKAGPNDPHVKQARDLAETAKKVRLDAAKLKSDEAKDHSRYQHGLLKADAFVVSIQNRLATAVKGTELYNTLQQDLANVQNDTSNTQNEAKSQSQADHDDWRRQYEHGDKTADEYVAFLNNQLTTVKPKSEEAYALSDEIKAIHQKTRSDEYEEKRREFENKEIDANQYLDYLKGRLANKDDDSETHNQLAEEYKNVQSSLPKAIVPGSVDDLSNRLEEAKIAHDGAVGDHVDDLQQYRKTLHDLYAEAGKLPKLETQQLRSQINSTLAGLAGPETAAPGATETTPAGKAGTKSTAVKLGTEFGSNFADGFSKGAVQKLNDILKDALSGHKSKFNLGKEVSSLFMSTVTSAIEKTASDYFTKQVGDFKRIVNPFQAIVDHGHQKPVVSTPSESPTTVPTNAAAGATEIEVPPDQPATTPTTPTAPASPGPTVPTNFVATATEIALPFIQDLTYKPPAAPSLTTPTFPLAMPNLPMFNGNAAKAIAWMTKAASSAGTTPGGAADIVAPLKLNVPLAMSIPTDRPVTITLIVAGGNGALSLNGALGAGLGGSSEGSGTALGQTVDGVVARSVQATDKAAAGFGKSLTKDSAKSAQSLIGAAQTIGEAGMFLTEAVSGQGKQKSAGMGGLLGMGLGLLAGSLLPGLSLLDGAGLGGTIGSLFGGLFADGGDPPVGQLSVVGEKGPELIRPRWSTTVVSNPDFRSLVSASGSVPVAAGTGGNINVHIAGGNVIREEADIHRIAKRSARLVEGAARMGVRYSGG